MNEWFIELYRIYYDQIYRYIFMLSVDKSMVEDMVQDTFMVLYKNQRKLKEHPCIEGWLFTTARNITWNHNKKKKRNKKYILELSTSALEQTYHIDTVPNNIYEILSDFLTDEEIEILKLNSEYGFTIKEIANKKGIKADTLQKKNYRSKLKVREILKKLFFIIVVIVVRGWTWYE